MFLDVPETIPLVSYPLRWVVPAELLDEMLGALVDLPGELNHVHTPEDEVVGLHGVRSGEGWTARQQLKHEDSKGPVVSRQVVTLGKSVLGWWRK